MTIASRITRVKHRDQEYVNFDQLPSLNPIVGTEKIWVSGPNGEKSTITINELEQHLDPITVKSATDFGTPAFVAAIGEVAYTLVDLKLYRIVGPITIPFPFFFPDGSFISFESDGGITSSITFVGSTTMIRSNDYGSMTFQQIALNAPIPGATIFNCSTSSTSTTNPAIFSVVNCPVGVAAAIGSVDSSAATAQKVVTLHQNAWIAADGLRINGAGLADITEMILQGASGGNSCLSFEGGTQVVTLSNLTFFPGTGGYAMNLVTTATYQGFILTGSNFSNALGGTLFNPTSANTETVGFQFKANTDSIPESTATGRVFTQNNATVTTVVSANTPVLAQATFSSQRLERFTATAAGRLTYIGLETNTFDISVLATIDPSGGSSKSVSAYIAINGTVVSESGQSIVAKDKNQVKCEYLVDLSTNDYIEIFIENNDDTTNLTLTDGSLKILKG